MKLNFLKTLVLKWIKKIILNRLKKKKLEIIKYINKKVDVPGLTEEQEQKHFEAQYQLILDVVKDVLG